MHAANRNTDSGPLLPAAGSDGPLFYVALARRVHNVHETKEPPAMRVRIGGYTKKDLVLLQ